MIVLTLEVIIIAILAVSACIGLLTLGLSLRRLLKNPPPMMRCHDHNLQDIEPQKIHDLFDYRRR